MLYRMRSAKIGVKELKTDLDYLMDLAERLEPGQRDKLVETLRGYRIKET